MKVLKTKGRDTAIFHIIYHIASHGDKVRKYQADGFMY